MSNPSVDLAPRGLALAWTGPAVVGVIALFSIFYTGSDYGVADHTIEIPIAKWYADPSLYPGDVGLEAWLAYPTPFWFLVGRLSRIVDLQLLLVALHVASRLATIAVVYLLAQRLSRSVAVASLSALLLAIDRPLPAGEWLSSLMIHREASVPLLLLAAYLFLVGRPLRALGAFAVGGILHALNGGYTLLGLGAFGVATVRRRKILALVTGLSALAACGAIATAFVFQTRLQSVVSLSEYLSFLRWRSGHHVFPATWGSEFWTGYWAWLALFVLGVRAATKTEGARPGTGPLLLLLVGFGFMEWGAGALGVKPVIDHLMLWRTVVIGLLAVWTLQVALVNRLDPPRLLLLCLAGTALVLNVAGIVFAEFAWVAFFAQLQLFRSSFWVHVAGSIFLAFYVAGRFTAATWPVRFALVGAATAWSFGDALAQLHFAAMLILVETVPERVILVRAGIAAALASYLFFLISPIDSSLFTSGSILVMRKTLLAGIPVAIAGTFLSAVRMARVASGLRPLPWLALGITCVSLAIGRHALRGGLRSEQSFQDWVQVQLWAKDSTAVDDMFIVPPGGLGGFRVFAERSVVSEFKDGNAIFHDPGFLPEWKARMEAHGRTPNAYRYDQLREADFMRIAERYHARYAVVGSRGPLCLPVEFSNRSFRVYWLGRALPRGPAADTWNSEGSSRRTDRRELDCPDGRGRTAGPAAGS